MRNLLSGSEMRANKKLLRLLDDRRMARSEVAAAVGVGYSTFRTYLNEDDPRTPSSDTGVKIARYLGVSADWLWDDAQNWPPPSPKMGPIGIIELIHLLEDQIQASTNDYDAAKKRLTKERLSRLDELAGRADRSPSEEKELQKGLDELSMLQSRFLILSNEASLISNILESVLGRDLPRDLTGDYPDLAKAFNEHFFNRVKTGPKKIETKTDEKENKD